MLIQYRDIEILYFIELPFNVTKLLNVPLKKQEKK